MAGARGRGGQGRGGADGAGAGGSATVAELAEALHKTRTRDLRRRTIARLEEAKVVECSGEIVTLARDWLDALDRERESAGEIAAHRRDMRRYNEQRAAYLDHLDRMRRGERPVPIPKRLPPRDVSDLVELEAPPPDPEIAEALAAYLDRNPRRREELPSWLSVAMWADGYTPIRVSPEKIAAVLLLITAA